MRTKPPSRTAHKAMNMSTRQPARRPLGPTKICFNPNLGRELGWKDSVDVTGKLLSADLTGFAEIIFRSFNRLVQEWTGHLRNRSSQTWNPPVRFALRCLNRPYSGSLGQPENLTKKLAARIKQLIDPGGEMRTSEHLSGLQVSALQVSWAAGEGSFRP